MLHIILLSGLASYTKIKLVMKYRLETTSNWIQYLWNSKRVKCERKQQNSLLFLTLFSSNG